VRENFPHTAGNISGMGGKAPGSCISDISHAEREICPSWKGKDQGLCTSALLELLHPTQYFP